ISAPFCADRSRWSMSRINFHIIAERQDFVEERIHQLLTRSARQVSAADRAGEQAIADKDFLLAGLKQHHMSRRMTGTVNHFEIQFADSINLTVAPMLVRLWRWFIIKAILAPL